VSAEARQQPTDAAVSVPSHGHAGHRHEAGGHAHGVGTDADRRYLAAAAVLLTVFLVGEVIAGLIADSLALLTDAGHMLTDVAALLLALWALSAAAKPARGRYTFGFKRAEILSAQANGVTLLLLGGWFVVEGIQRLIDPPEVEGGIVLVVAVIGIVVNLVATWLLSRANRSSLNVEGAFQHILTDLFAFVGTAVAGLVVLLTGFGRADAIAALIVAALMLRSGWRLLRDSGRVLLEAAPAGINPSAVELTMRSVPGVLDVHDLHVWEVTSGFPALAAHVVADSHAECHAVRAEVAKVLAEQVGIRHCTLQVDHPTGQVNAGVRSAACCPEDLADC
jgi:cobalt-zinc-cadmium efflux system protein